MIASGLALELIAAILVIVGLVLSEPQAATVLLTAIGVVIAGLLITTLGVRRARPPRRGVVALPPEPWSGATSDRRNF